MSTYYDELGLPPQASAAELETALDARYNQYRNLVTHPDATVVEEANRNLRLLEQMRATLTDTNRRAAYDAGIGVGGAGGLADPAAILRKATPPPPPRATAPTQAGAPADLWACPNCSTPNPEWTPFCLKCRTPLLRQCPECGQMKSLVKTGACGNCGYEYDVAKRRAELKGEIDHLKNQKAVMEREFSEEYGWLSPAWQPGRRFQWERILLVPAFIALFFGATLFFGAIFLTGGISQLGSSLPQVLLLILAGILLLAIGLGCIKWYRRKRSSLIAGKRMPITKLESQIQLLESEYQAIGKQHPTAG